MDLLKDYIDEDELLKVSGGGGLTERTSLK